MFIHLLPVDSCPLAVRAADEGKIGGRSNVEDPHKRGQQRDIDLSPGLFGAKRRDAIAHMLASQPHGIALPEPAIKEPRQPYALAGAERPSGLLGDNLVLGPDRETFDLALV